MFTKLTYAFSDLKYTEENTNYYNLFKEKFFRSMYHNNTTFIKKKLFILNDFLKLRVRKDPIKGEILSNIIYLSGINAQKRYNIFCTIRPFNNSNCNKTLVCVIIEKNGIAELF